MAKGKQMNWQRKRRNARHVRIMWNRWEWSDHDRLESRTETGGKMEHDTRDFF